jgi:hypothetical protein
VCVCVCVRARVRAHTFLTVELMYVFNRYEAVLSVVEAAGGAQSAEAATPYSILLPTP